MSDQQFDHSGTSLDPPLSLPSQPLLVSDWQGPPRIAVASRHTSSHHHHGEATIPFVPKPFTFTAPHAATITVSSTSVRPYTTTIIPLVSSINNESTKEETPSHDEDDSESHQSSLSPTISETNSPVVHSTKASEVDKPNMNGFSHSSSHSNLTTSVIHNLKEPVSSSSSFIQPPLSTALPPITAAPPPLTTTTISSSLIKGKCNGSKSTTLSNQIMVVPTHCSDELASESGSSRVIRLDISSDQSDEESGRESACDEEMVHEADNDSKNSHSQDAHYLHGSVEVNQTESLAAHGVNNKIEESKEEEGESVFESGGKTNGRTVNKGTSDDSGKVMNERVSVEPKAEEEVVVEDREESESHTSEHIENNAAPAPHTNNNQDSKSKNDETESNEESDDFWSEKPSKPTQKINMGESLEGGGDDKQGTDHKADTSSSSSSSITQPQQKDYSNVITTLIATINSNIRKERELAQQLYTQPNLTDGMKDQIQDSPVLSSLLTK